MLIRFTAANHRSLKEPVELSLVAVDDERDEVRHFDRLHEGILPVAAIYGPNASGKSNVVDALSWLSHAVRHSLRLWDDFIPREPFRFAGFSQQPSVFELDFMFNDVRHTYTLQLTEAGVEFEELLSYPERKARRLFVRDHANLTFRRGVLGAGSIKEILTPTTLALSLAHRFEVSELRGPASFVGNISTPFIRRRGGSGAYAGPRVMGTIGPSTTRLFLQARRSSGVSGQQSLFTSSTQEDVDTALSLLRFADLGIEDVEVVELPDSAADRSRYEIRLVHRVGDERELFELGEESDGTRMWFRLLSPALAALARGIPLVLDELDASLHPLLSAKLIEIFHSPETNPKNAQLIFTTHDTTLMKGLNRDEVWFTEKGSDGATALTALAEYGGDRVRKSLNIERAYLHGRFGALPNLRESALLAVSDAADDTEDPDGHPEESQDSDDTSQ
ncbi:MAG: uncharacterized protein QG671_2805 [Actinomycetota bacterium]|nr:uncharacterized protein [Actinomycetota bacterium]